MKTDRNLIAFSVIASDMLLSGHVKAEAHQNTARSPMISGMLLSCKTKDLQVLKMTLEKILSIVNKQLEEVELE